MARPIFYSMIIKIVLYPLIVYFSLIAILLFFQNSLIYFPDPTQLTPAQAGVPDMEVVELKTEDSLTLKAWYKAPTEGRPTIVYFHGNGGNIANRAFVARGFIDLGYGFLLVEYRGYGGNPGRPTEEGLYEDGRAAMRFVLGDVVLYGESLGSAVAVQMALEYKVRAMVLQSPFTTLYEVAYYHYPFFPSLLRDKYDSVSKASRISVPVLVLVGGADELIPPAMGESLLSQFRGFKQYILVPHATHNDLFAPALVDTFLK